MIGGLFTAESYAELTNAFSTVYAELVAKEIAYMREQGTLSEDATLSLTPSFRLERNEDGSLTFTISSRMLNPGAPKGSSSKNLDVTVERSLTIKDGKVVGLAFVMREQLDQPDQPDDNGEFVTCQGELSIEYTVVYAFDEEAYNNISVTLPEDESEIYVEKPEFGIVIVLNEYAIKSRVFFTDPESTEAVLRQLASHYDHCGGKYDEETDEYTPYMTIRGFYLDAALTQPVDPTISLDELAAIGTLYADWHIEEGYAYVTTYRQKEVARSRAYEIVYAPFFFGMGDCGDMDPLIEAGTIIYLDRDAEHGQTVKIYVNGVETDADSFVAESGKLYGVVIVVTDTDDAFTVYDVTPLF